MNRTATFEPTLHRFIRAPREKVYDAFVTEAGVKGWMCPRGMTIPEMKLDARDGGTEVRMTHSGFPDEALCESHKEGWGSCLNRLADQLDPHTPEILEVHPGAASRCSPTATCACSRPAPSCATSRRRSRGRRCCRGTSATGRSASNG